MYKSLAIAKRILSQFAHDKRTLGLLFVAPIVVLWLLSVLLSADMYEPRLAAVGLPGEYEQALIAQDASVEVLSSDEAERRLRANEVDAVLSMSDESTLSVWVEGSDSTKTAAVASVVQSALADCQDAASQQMEEDIAQKKEDATRAGEDAREAQEQVRQTFEQAVASLPPSAQSALSEPLQQALDGLDFSSASDALAFDIDPIEYMPVEKVETSYLHGDESWRMFDFYGPVFIGLFLFVFVFITSGMSLVNERAAGTMGRFLATPVAPRHILGGYVMGFGALAFVQSAVIIAVALGVIGFPNEGNVLLVSFVAVSLALVSVTMGLAVSGLAHNSFQVIQLMLLFVAPQILLCGLFDLSCAPQWLQAVSGCLPLTYGVDALRGVMLRGATLGDIAFDVAIIWAFIGMFFVLASFGFRKKRARRA